MLSEERLRLLLAPYLGSETEGGPVVPADLYARLASYLDLLLKWNARTNLTAIREPEEIVRRHFGESLFAGKVLESIAGRLGTLMDLGSGAGFPGIPMQLLLPGWRVTLAESQGKKAAFLREAVRVLGLDTEVWAGRVEDIGPEKAFDGVAMRAVDRMGSMEDVARGRLVEGGVLLRLTTEVREGVARVPVPGDVPGYVEWRRF